jgi:hypothetical protein
MLWPTSSAHMVENWMYQPGIFRSAARMRQLKKMGGPVGPPVV